MAITHSLYNKTITVSGELRSKDLGGLIHACQEAGALAPEVYKNLPIEMIFINVVYNSEDYEWREIMRDVFEFVLKRHHIVLKLAGNRDGFYKACLKIMEESGGRKAHMPKYEITAKTDGDKIITVTGKDQLINISGTVYDFDLPHIMQHILENYLFKDYPDIIINITDVTLLSVTRTPAVEYFMKAMSYLEIFYEVSYLYNGEIFQNKNVRR